LIRGVGFCLDGLVLVVVIFDVVDLDLIIFGLLSGPLPDAFANRGGLFFSAKLLQPVGAH